MTRSIALTLGAALAAALLALPAAAQKNTQGESSGGTSGGWGSGASGGGAAICGVPGGQVTWLGGGPGSSDIAASAGPLYIGAEIDGTNPGYFAFSASSEVFLRLEARAMAAGDTVLTLLDESGYEIGFDDDSGGEMASRIETPLGAGTYCLAVSGYDSARFDAEIQVGRNEHMAITVGVAGAVACTPDTPAAGLTDWPLDRVLAAGDVVAVTAVPDQQRYFRFELAGPSSMTIRASNEDADPVLRLYGPDGTLLYENDDYDNLNSVIQVIDPLAPGVYCIEVAALNDELLPIMLGVESFDEEAYLQAAYAAGEISPPPGSGYPVADIGTLSTQLASDMVVGSDAKWARFTLAEPSLVLLQAIAMGNVDPIISLFGANGESLAINDDGTPGQPDSMLARELGPGTYMVAVTLFDSSATGSVRLLLDRYVRAQ